MDLGDPDDFTNKLDNLVAVGGQAFFTKGSGLLYRSDGTVSGTLLVKEFYTEYGLDPATAGLNFTHAFCARNGLLYLVVGDSMDPQVAVWCSDGTAGDTRRIWQPGMDYAITRLWNTPDGLYAAASHNFNVCELWRISPENGAAQRVFYLDTTPQTSGVYELASLNGQVYFSLLEAQQLWKTSGGAQAVMVAEIPPPSGLAYKPSIGGLAATDRALVFSAQTAAAGDELWTSDGTTGGTRLLKDFTAGPQSSEFVFVPLDGGDLFMWVKDSVAGNWPFWKTDGTDAGTTQALLYEFSMPPLGVCKVGADYLLPYSAPATGMEPYLLTEGSFAITQQPRPLDMAVVDSTVRFTVGVPEWARPWTQYQWLLDGAPVTGAIAPDLVIPAVQYTDAGLYSCRVVFNDGGGDTTLVSTAARLTVVESVPVLNVPMSAVLALLLCAVAGVLVARRENHRAPSTKA
jgi:ELWxxDGT repeat protein